MKTNAQVTSKFCASPFHSSVIIKCFYEQKSECQKLGSTSNYNTFIVEPKHCNPSGICWGTKRTIQLRSCQSAGSNGERSGSCLLLIFLSIACWRQIVRVYWARCVASALSEWFAMCETRYSHSDCGLVYLSFPYLTKLHDWKLKLNFEEDNWSVAKILSIKFYVVNKRNFF